MKSGAYIDPFIRTKEGLLKRLDSIGSVFNKTGAPHPNIVQGEAFVSNFKRLSQLSSKFMHRDTPLFGAEMQKFQEAGYFEDPN
jgi:hypothetical protein